MWKFQGFNLVIFGEGPFFSAHHNFSAYVTWNSLEKAWCFITVLCILWTFCDFYIALIFCFCFTILLHSFPVSVTVFRTVYNKVPAHKRSHSSLRFCEHGVKFTVHIDVSYFHFGITITYPFEKGKRICVPMNCYRLNNVSPLCFPPKYTAAVIKITLV